MRVDILMCVDEAFALPLAVALVSVDRSAGDESLVAHVLHPGFPESTKRRITATLRRTEVRWYTVDERMTDAARPSVFLSRASLYRLLVDSVLPPEIGRVIYIDADVVVLDSLAPLMRAELGEAAVGAVRDANAVWAAGPLAADWRTLGMDPSAPYFNSGVMVIDRERWRSLDAEAAALTLLRRVALRWGDQDALNAVLEGRWAELDRRWNLQTADAAGASVAWALWREEVERATAGPAIVHFTEREKPWMFGAQHPFLREWLAALDDTSWSGWRPAASRPSRLDPLVRLGRRLREHGARKHEGLPP